VIVVFKHICIHSEFIKFNCKIEKIPLVYLKRLLVIFKL
jgi:hypothetical protein